MTQLQRWLTIGGIAVATTLSACSSSNDASDSAAQGQTCTSLPPLALKDTYRVGFAQLYEANGPWRDANTKSIVDEAARRGWELVYTPGPTADAAEQVDRMQALIDAKVDVILLAPHDEANLAPTVVAARKACIPVFIEDRAVDTNIAVPGLDYVTYIGSDFVKEGELTADWLIQKTGGHANIIEFEGTVGSSAAVGRKQGFDGRIAGQPGMKLLFSQDADFDEQKAHDLLLEVLPQYPTADVIFSHNDGMSFGIITALQQLGKEPGRDIMLLSIDGTLKATQYVIEGKISELTECNPKFGPVVFDTILKYAQGEQIPTVMKNNDRTFDATNAASYLPEAF